MPSTQRQAVLPQDAPEPKRNSSDAEVPTSAEASTSAERIQCCDTSERSDETVPELLQALNLNEDRRRSSPSPILSPAELAGNNTANVVNLNVGSGVAADALAATATATLLPTEENFGTMANMLGQAHEMITEVSEVNSRRTQDLYNKFAAESERVADRMDALDSNVARFMRQEKADRAQGDMVGQRRMRNMERKVDSKFEEMRAELTAHFETLLHEQREYYEGRSQEFPRAGPRRGSLGGDARRRSSSSSAMREVEGNIRNGRRSIGGLGSYGYDSNIIEEDRVYGFAREEDSTCTDNSDKKRQGGRISRWVNAPFEVTKNVATGIVAAPINATQFVASTGAQAAEATIRTSMDIVDYFPLGSYATWAANKVFQVDRGKNEEEQEAAAAESARSPTPESDHLDQRN